MSEKIINKVANSDLITIDLSDYSPKKIIVAIDIKDFLFEGVILREKEFRAQLKEFDFSVFSNKIVAIYCSSDVIIPMWAYMLIASYLNPISDVYFGEEEMIFNHLLIKNIEAINSSEYKNRKVIVKGCGNTPITEEMYVAITKKLQNIVNSLMFGEACSAVPVFKKS